MTKTMFLIHAGDENGKTFTLVPISKDCPWLEARYSLVPGMLGIILKDNMDGFRMLPRLNGAGYPQPDPRKGPKEVKTERVRMMQPYEFTVNEQEDIRGIVKEMAVNFDSFDIEPFLAFKLPELPKAESEVAEGAVRKPMKDLSIVKK